MDDIAVTNAVQNEYKARWGKEVRADVVLIQSAGNGGSWVSVDTVYPGDKKMSEVCFIDSRGKAMVFSSTPELVRHLGARHPWEKRFLSPSTVGAFAFLLTLVAVIAMIFLKIDNQPGADALKGLLALAAGFYFGNQAKGN